MRKSDENRIDSKSWIQIFVRWRSFPHTCTYNMYLLGETIYSIFLSVSTVVDVCIICSVPAVAVSILLAKYLQHPYTFSMRSRNGTRFNFAGRKSERAEKKCFLCFPTEINSFVVALILRICSSDTAVRYVSVLKQSYKRRAGEALTRNLR